MNPPAQFWCYICSDPSTNICLYCTKDACDNHLCESVAVAATAAPAKSPGRAAPGSSG